MWSKKRKSIFLRRIQQSSEHTLKVNLPKRYTELNKLERGDFVSCEIIRLSDGKFVMIVDKIDVTNSMSIPEELAEKLEVS